ncbi:hypothetical protein [Methylomonas albis]|uniref:DUF983 domain-containing protein n=1 Tax=Methylomonas albis TaxID=1854563 RepID=A0ABR9CZK3_9GAMM|nr:hypothetical protein [Methylomonas albis]MBD9356309.1 hypothetical protein [Methylomonas albis]
MFNCQCGSCQKNISWQDISWGPSSNSLLPEAFILCPFCKTRLDFNGQARAIAYIVEIASFVMLVYLFRNWGISRDWGITWTSIYYATMIYIGFIVGGFIEKRLIYAISLLFFLPPVVRDAEEL